MISKLQEIFNIEAPKGWRLLHSDKAVNQFYGRTFLKWKVIHTRTIVISNEFGLPEEDFQFQQRDYELSSIHILLHEISHAKTSGSHDKEFWTELIRLDHKYKIPLYIHREMEDMYPPPELWNGI
jgi:hypothetical protein